MARLEAELEQAKRLRKALFKIADLSDSVAGMDEFYAVVHRTLAEFMYADSFFIVLYDGEQDFSCPYFCDSQGYSNFFAKLSAEDIRQSLIGYVFKTSQPLLASYEKLCEMQAQGLFRIYGASMHEWLGVPLLQGNVVLGVMVVQSYRVDQKYLESDKEFLVFIAHHIVLALTHTRAEHKLQRVRDELESRFEFRTAELKRIQEQLEIRVDQRTKQLSVANEQFELQVKERERAEKLQTALYRIAEIANRSVDLGDFYLAIHNIVNELMYAENFYIALLNEESGYLEFAYVVDQFRHEDDYKPRSLSGLSTSRQGYTEYVIKTRQALLVGPESSGPDNVEWIGQDMFAWLGVPLLLDNQSIGALVVQSYSEAFWFTGRDRDLLMFVSQHIATALKRKRNAELLSVAHAELRHVNDELEHRVRDRIRELSDANVRLQEMLTERREIEQRLAHDACHDGLTGLPNKMLLLDRLDNTIKRKARLNDVSYAVMFLDLDRFKIVNDSMGHIEGDRLLQEVGNRLMSCVRPGDTVARLGGDEFCILVDDSRSDVIARQVAERILDKIAEPFRLKNQVVFISASIGITLSSMGYQNPEMVLRDADVAMYYAKSKGKAQYAFFDRVLHQQAINLLKAGS